MVLPILCWSHATEYELREAEHKIICALRPRFNTPYVNRQKDVATAHNASVEYAKELESHLTEGDPLQGVRELCLIRSLLTGSLLYYGTRLKVQKRLKARKTLPKRTLVCLASHNCHCLLFAVNLVTYTTDIGELLRLLAGFGNTSQKSSPSSSGSVARVLIKRRVIWPARRERSNRTFSKFESSQI